MLTLRLLPKVIYPKEYGALAKQLGITEASLKNFFTILKQKNVPPEDLDHTLREFATRYNELVQTLATSSSIDPAVGALKQDALTALEAGEFARAEIFLTEAKKKDIDAAKVIQEAGQERLLSAAESAAQLGRLKHSQLAYAEAAAYFSEAAKLVPSGNELVRARYLHGEGRCLVEAGKYTDAQEPLERAVAIRKQALGLKHPDVAKSLNNLAIVPPPKQGRRSRATLQTSIDDHKKNPRHQSSPGYRKPR